MTNRDAQGMTSDSCIQACQALRDNRPVRLVEETIEPLLLWLCGGRNGAAETVYRILGSPFDYPDQLERVYRSLDKALFRDEELLVPAGTREQRHRRYRQLSRAFHPDRYPHMADWLGLRAQTINAAFDRFRKQGETDPGRETPVNEVKRSSRAVVRRPDNKLVNRVGLRERWISLIAPLGHSRFLAQKILLLTAIVCALPLVYLYRQHISTEEYVHTWPDTVVSENATLTVTLPETETPVAADPLATNVTSVQGETSSPAVIELEMYDPEQLPSRQSDGLLNISTMELEREE